MIRVDVFRSKISKSKSHRLDMDREHYCKKALECVSAAEQAHDPWGRFELLRIAQGFMWLAKQAAARSDPQAAMPLSEVEPGVRVA